MARTATQALTGSASGASNGGMSTLSAMRAARINRHPHAATLSEALRRKPDLDEMEAALAVVDQIVAAEREACAEVAEDESNGPAPESARDGSGWIEPSVDDIRRSIASAIRNRS